MKKFKTIEKMREYNRAKARKRYQDIMADPEKAEAYRIKRRKYEKQRYREMMKELKGQV